MPKTGHTAAKSWIFITIDTVDASLCKVRHSLSNKLLLSRRQEVGSYNPRALE